MADAPPFVGELASFTLSLNARHQATGDLTLLARVLASAGWRGFNDARVIVEFIRDGHLRLYRLSGVSERRAEYPGETEDDRQLQADRFHEAPVYHGDSTRVRFPPEIVTLIIPRPKEFTDGVLFEQARSDAIDVMTNDARRRRLRDSA